MTQAPNESGSKADDPFQSIKQMAAEIIQPRRNSKAHKESKAVKSFRRQAMEGGPGRDARELWKKMWKTKRRERNGAESS